MLKVLTLEVTMRLTALSIENERLHQNTKNEPNLTERAIDIVLYQINFSNLLSKQSQGISCEVGEAAQLIILQEIVTTGRHFLKKWIGTELNRFGKLGKAIQRRDFLKHLETEILTPALAEKYTQLSLKYGVGKQRTSLGVQDILAVTLLSQQQVAPVGHIDNFGHALEWLLSIDFGTAFMYQRQPFFQAVLLQPLSEKGIDDLSVNFSEVTPQLLEKDFFLYYRLLTLNYPSAVANNQEQKERFQAKSQAFVKTIRFMQGRWKLSKDAFIVKLFNQIANTSPRILPTAEKLEKWKVQLEESVKKINQNTELLQEQTKVLNNYLEAVLDCYLQYETISPRPCVWQT